MVTQELLESKKTYDTSDIIPILGKLQYKLVNKNKSLSYYNIPCCFDIETSSFYNAEGEKQSTMYIWMLSLSGYVIIGRTWSDFIYCMDEIVDWLELNLNQRLIVYVHNLQYEFQWFRHYFEWKKVFALDTRRPIYGVTSKGLEFRCSYLLSGYSLAKLSDELLTYKISKKVGDLDYKLVRHSKSILTEKELGYCIGDVQVVVAYIQEQIDQCGDITKIPLTKTGYVRRYCRDECFFEKDKPKKKSLKRWKYHELMMEMQLSSEDYEQVHKAFQGGFTHANAFYVGKKLQDVASYDFTSSYPAALIAEKYPTTTPKRVELKDKKDFYYYLQYYACVFDIYIEGLQSVTLFENYISTSKCRRLKGCVLNNGRVVSADVLEMTVTEQDFFIISRVYKWNKLMVGNFKTMMRDYLPTDLVKSILKLYEDKTTLKGMEGKEIEYMVSKGMLNSVYGCMVTSIVRPEHEYKHDWITTQPDVEEQIKKYNIDRNRFLFYPWGVYCTAFSRANLWSGILSLQDEYVYSDTDSLKVLNHTAHAAYFENYNKRNHEKMLKAMHFHGLDEGLVHPKTIKGVEKWLGDWDFEGVYTHFKTLGAKRYMVEEEGEVNITVSGLNKRTTVPYLLQQAEKKGCDVFDLFTEDLYIPPEYTGKNTHTYIDTPMTGIVTDYMGQSAKYTEYSGIHLQEADYSLSLSEEFVSYLLDIKEEGELFD